MSICQRPSLLNFEDSCDTVTEMNPVALVFCAEDAHVYQVPYQQRERVISHLEDFNSGILSVGEK